ncbi:heat shock 70 kDa protein 12B-like [Ylistrum balloti]|uniref:heat shock 70 kDa protein 12B-like n=1 Tax=Ylistrum balloti TaxID=509963 RepID=UPI002905803D|nr:heat shock 70 kDa protein 12B-like [Ylistrum balloti]
MASTQKLLVVAIDFGTTYSGYAFSFYNEYKLNKNAVHTTLWQAGEGLEKSTKAPTCILFDSRQRFHSFGYNAENTYSRLSDEAQKQCFFFKRFKMSLFKNENLNERTMIKDVSGKDMLAMNVFSAGIKYLRDHFHELLQERFSSVLTEDIHWVLTVPAIWNEAAKQFMRKAALSAEITEARLTLALEPEAAALYCKSNIHQLGKFDKGNTFMIVDAGGGTVDVTVHKVHLSGVLKEIHSPSGGPWGGTKVDDAFQTFLLKVFGVGAIRRMSKTETLEIEREFEIFKRSFDPSATMSSVNIRIPYCLRECLDESKARSQSIRIRGDKMIVPHHTVKTFFQQPVQKIVTHIRELINKPGVSSTKDIYLVGGFSENKLLQKEIAQQFPYIHIHTPTEANSAVIKGAVIFGHDPDIIGWRISPYTYGIGSCCTFDHHKHPRYKLRILDGEEYCSDIFTKFITIGTTMKNGRATPYQRFCPVSRNQTVMSIEVVTSPSEDPTYTTELGCQVLGTIKVRIPDLTGGTHREVKVRMIMGGTELQVEAEDGNTGATYAAKFDCL